MSVSSLFDTALLAVMRDFHHHESALRYLPSGVKCRVAGVMAKRGLMNERNMSLVSVLMCPLPHCSPPGRMAGVIWGLTEEAALIVGNLTRPFQLLFLFLVRVFHGIDAGGQVLSNLENKYFNTKHYSSLTPYTTAK